MTVSAVFQDRLVTACYRKDLASVQAAIADGASLNAKGSACRGYQLTPLVAATSTSLPPVALYLVAHGAVPDHPKVVYMCALEGSAAELATVIAAGGSVNAPFVNVSPIVAAVRSGVDASEKVALLLDEPSFDIASCVFRGKPLEADALTLSKPDVAAMIADAVGVHNSVSPCVDFGCVCRGW